MGEWQDRQIGYGAICSMFFWAMGVALIVAAIVGLVPGPCANLGNVLFMVGCLRTVLAVLRARLNEERNAFELGYDSALMREGIHVVRD